MFFPGDHNIVIKMVKVKCQSIVLSGFVSGNILSLCRIKLIKFIGVRLKLYNTYLLIKYYDECV